MAALLDSAALDQAYDTGTALAPAYPRVGRVHEAPHNQYQVALPRRFSSCSRWRRSPSTGSAFTTSFTRSRAWSAGRRASRRRRRPTPPGGRGRDRGQHDDLGATHWRPVRALLLGVVIVTSEFASQTAAVTFVTVPRRATVIRAKVTAAAGCGALFWLVGTVIAAVATPPFLYSQHISTSLAGWIVARSVLLNLVAFAVWGVLRRLWFMRSCATRWPPSSAR